MAGTRTKFDEIEVAALNELFEMYNQYPKNKACHETSVFSLVSYQLKRPFRGKDHNFLNNLFVSH